MNKDNGLGTALRWVRTAQHYAAVFAEGLILLAFAMSSVDVSIGGRLASIPLLAWMWAAAFALGIDTSFILSWIRVREIIRDKKTKKRHLWWAIPLALGMGFIVFQPVAVQQLQQSMNISFNAALANLGINLNVLVYARSLVAVMLGAVLAMTNVEQAPKTDAHKVVRVVAEPVAEVKANIPAELPEKAESLVNKEVIMAKLLANPGESMANLAKETGVPRSTLRYWQQKGQFPQGKPDKLRLTLDTLQDNPGITDEELARVLSISRPSAARFWRLKAKELGND